jgi:hypothetical protein
MNEEQQIPLETTNRHFAVVAGVLDDDYVVVINRGQRDGIKKGQKFLIYAVSPEEIRDPTNGESLGHLETVKGTGTVSHLQEKMATITSDQRSSNRRVVKRNNWGSMAVLGIAGETEEFETTELPFKSPKVGDYARPI